MMFCESPRDVVRFNGIRYVAQECGCNWCNLNIHMWRKMFLRKALKRLLV